MRIEMDTRAVSGWNELDYVRLTGAASLRKGVVRMAASSSSQTLYYVPDQDYHGTETVAFRVW